MDERLEYFLRAYTLYGTDHVMEEGANFITRAKQLPNFHTTVQGLHVLHASVFKEPDNLEFQQLCIRTLSVLLFGSSATNSGKWTDATKFNFQEGTREIQFSFESLPGNPSMRGAWYFSHFSSLEDMLEALIIPFTKFVGHQAHCRSEWRCSPHAYRMEKQAFLRTILDIKDFNQLYPHASRTIRLYTQNIILFEVDQFAFFKELARIMFHVQGTRIVDRVQDDSHWYFTTENGCKCNFFFTGDEGYFRQSGVVGRGGGKAPY